MSVYTEWFADIGRASEELGLFVESMTNGTITLIDPTPKTGEVRIIIESRPFLSGAEIRRIIRPLEERKPA